MNVRELCRLCYRVSVSAVTRKGYVVRYRVAEKEVILRHVSRVLSDRAYRYRIYVVAVDKERTVGNVVGAQYQVNECGLSRARLSYDAHALSRLYLEGHVHERVVFRLGVTEGESSELYLAAKSLGFFYVFPIPHVRLSVKQNGDSLERSLSARTHLYKLRYRHNGPDYRGKISYKFNELSCVERTFPYEITAVSEYDADHRFNKEHHQNIQKR